MVQEFDVAFEYKYWWQELILAALCLISLICASRLTHLLRKSRHLAQTQAKFMMDHSMDSLLNNSPDYALTEFVLFMSISDILRSIIGTFQYIRSAFNLWTTCYPNSFSGVLCLIEEFIKWSLISNDIICYGVICFCLFRYLRKRSIFTQHSITPTRIRYAIMIISISHSTIQTVLVILYTDYTFNYEIIYIPSLIILYCTILYILSVFTYIRCCHPFWLLGKNTKSQYIFMIVFTVIFIIPITLKMILAMIPHHLSSFKTLYFISDILLTQTGSGNFLAWFYNQRYQLLPTDSDSKLFFNMEDSVELGSDIEYVIDIQQMNKKYKPQNGVKKHKKKKSTFSKLSLFSNTTNNRSTTTETINSPCGPSQGGQSISYKPPSIDVMAMEPVIKMSDISYSAESNNNHQLFLDSNPNTFVQPDNMEQHILNQYGNDSIDAHDS